MENLMNKFCKDCKYFYLPWHHKLLRGMEQFGECDHPKLIKIDTNMVSGKVFITREYCEFERWKKYSCGPTGNFWEKK